MYEKEDFYHSNIMWEASARLEEMNTRNSVMVSEQTIDALKMASRYACGDLTVGTDEITNILCDALCEIIGDEAYQKWSDSLSQQEQSNG